MHQKYCVFYSLLVSTATLFSQEKFTFSGTIVDQQTNETLIGVNIIFPELNVGTTTNEYGFFSLTLPENNYKVLLTYLGYQEIQDSLLLNQDVVKNYKLSESIEQLQEVVIKEDIERLNIRSPQMSVNSLTANTIKEIPAILGEPDVIKSIILSVFKIYYTFNSN